MLVLARPLGGALGIQPRDAEKRQGRERKQRRKDRDTPLHRLPYAPVGVWPYQLARHLCIGAIRNTTTAGHCYRAPFVRGMRQGTSLLSSGLKRGTDSLQDSLEIGAGLS